MAGRTRHKEQGTPILEISLSSPGNAAAFWNVRNCLQQGFPVKGACGIGIHVANVVNHGGIESRRYVRSLPRRARFSEKRQEFLCQGGQRFIIPIENEGIQSSLAW